MPRLVVYIRSSFCPDVARWRRWVSQHPLEYVEIDIDRDRNAYAKVVAWTGHLSVPTLVIAPDDGLEPVDEPLPLPPNRGPRAVDRGAMLSEPSPGQIGPFLERHGISYGAEQGDAQAPSEGAPVSDAPRGRPWWRRF